MIKLTVYFLFKKLKTNYIRGGTLNEGLGRTTNMPSHTRCAQKV